MSKDDIKYEVEKQEAGFLFKHLGVTPHPKCESPDFTFVYEEKLVGLEHTRWFPNGKTIDNNAWHEIEQLIREELDKSDLPQRLILYTAVTHDDGKKSYKEIAEEIIKGYRFMLDKGINYLSEWDYYELKFDKLSYLSYFPDMILDHFGLSEMLGGRVSENDLTTLTDTIKKKEKKLMEYRKDPKNNDIQEYWLSVYIPLQEFCIAEGDSIPFKNSLYDRIYLVNGRDWVRTNGDTSSIIRLK
ncbi:MAG: hypothetical protein IJK22_06040 [Bacteroidales bacterium]|nr:hypothetical protein [Bacteroidales bacterium]